MVLLLASWIAFCGICFTASPVLLQCFLFCNVCLLFIPFWTNILWYLFHPVNSHKTRLHIGRLVKDTSDKLKQASDADHGNNVSVSIFSTLQIYGLHTFLNWVLMRSRAKIWFHLPSIYPGKQEDCWRKTCKRFPSSFEGIPEGSTSCGRTGNIIYPFDSSGCPSF